MKLLEENIEKKSLPDTEMAKDLWTGSQSPENKNKK
jgi:hypothetical protein